MYIELRFLLKGEFTVEGALLEITNLMCKIDQNKIIICEPAKKNETYCRAYKLYGT